MRTGGEKYTAEEPEDGKKNYIDGGNNQVILITDGDMNFGITDKGGLEELIEREKNAADLHKLAEILEESEKELGVGIPKEPFPW